MKTCSAADCERPVRARGLCTMHYERAKRAGEFVAGSLYATPGVACKPEAESCDRKPVGHGLCGKHLMRVRRRGTTVLPGKPSWEPRFWERVYPEPNTGCWLWGGAIASERGGYGRFALNRDMIGAHVVAYELLVGPVPAGLTLDHLCFMTCCVNPDHLEPVTRAVNSQRAAAARERARAAQSDLGPGWVKPKPAALRPVFAVPS